MSRSLAVALIGMIGVAFGAGACSTTVYTSGDAARDLERHSPVTHTQAECIVTAIRRYFEAEITASQRANKGSPLPADRLKLEVDSALALLRAPKAGEQLGARRAIAKCAPGALL